VGAALAARLGWTSIDGDSLLAARTGMPAGRYLETAGEVAFRTLEEELTLAALAPGQPRVLACGGGAVLSARVRAALRQPGVLAVFLTAPVADLVRRLAACPGGRPPLTRLPLAEEVASLLAQRLPFYEEVCDLRLETATTNADACAAAILAKMAAS
jgi:shikimate kinase